MGSSRPAPSGVGSVALVAATLGAAAPRAAAAIASPTCPQGAESPKRPPNLDTPKRPPNLDIRCATSSTSVSSSRVRRPVADVFVVPPSSSESLPPPSSLSLESVSPSSSPSSITHQCVSHSCGSSPHPPMWYPQICVSVSSVAIQYFALWYVSPGFRVFLHTMRATVPSIHPSSVSMHILHPARICRSLLTRWARVFSTMCSTAHLHCDIWPIHLTCEWRAQRGSFRRHCHAVVVAGAPQPSILHWVTSVGGGNCRMRLLKVRAGRFVFGYLGDGRALLAHVRASSPWCVAANLAARPAARCCWCHALYAATPCASP